MHSSTRAQARQLETQTRLQQNLLPATATHSVSENGTLSSRLRLCAPVLGAVRSVSLGQLILRRQHCSATCQEREAYRATHHHLVVNAVASVVCIHVACKHTQNVSKAQLQVQRKRLSPCIPDLADAGPDITTHPSTKAAISRSVRSVLPFPTNTQFSVVWHRSSSDNLNVRIKHTPLGPQKMRSSVCGPNCSAGGRASQSLVSTLRPTRKRAPKQCTRSSCIRRQSRPSMKPASSARGVSASIAPKVKTRRLTVVLEHLAEPVHHVPKHRPVRVGHLIVHSKRHARSVLRHLLQLLHQAVVHGLVALGNGRRVNPRCKRGFL